MGLHLPHKKQNNHNHNHHHQQGSSRGGGSGGGGGGGVPKGCLAIKVGQTDEDQQRFVVPVGYFNHPLFMKLLKEAEEEYGFEQKGTITIPCHVEEFRYVQGLIDRDSSNNKSFHHHHHHHYHHHHQQQQHHHNPIVGCFRA